MLWLNWIFESIPFQNSSFQTERYFIPKTWYIHLKSFQHRFCNTLFIWNGSSSLRYRYGNRLFCNIWNCKVSFGTRSGVIAKQSIGNKCIFQLFTKIVECGSFFTNYSNSKCGFIEIEKEKWFSNAAEFVWLLFMGMDSGFCCEIERDSLPYSNQIKHFIYFWF